MMTLKSLRMTTLYGFTLIELLVVVLIIGILAAAALPQYRAAVAKSRVAALIPIMRSFQLAQQRYYMANGEFAKNIRDLDVSCAHYGTVQKDWCFLDETGRASIHIDEGYYFSAGDNRVPGVSLLFLFTTVRYPAFCHARDGANEAFSNQVCKSLTGDAHPGRVTGTTTYRFWD